MQREPTQQGRWFVVLLFSLIGLAVLAMVALPPLANRSEAVCRFTGGRIETHGAERGCFYSEGSP